MFRIIILHKSFFCSDCEVTILKQHGLTRSDYILHERKVRDMSVRATRLFDFRARSFFGH